METLTHEEDLVLLRLVDELKRYPRLRRPLIEALQMAELLEVPQQLVDLRAMVEQILRTQEEQRHTLEEHGRILTEHGRMLEQVLRTQEEQRHTLEEHGRILTEHGRMLEQVLRTQEEQRHTLEEHGRMLEEHGRTLTEHGHMLEQVLRTQEDHGARLANLERDVATLKGNSEELHAAKRIPSVLGKLLRKLRIYDTHQFGLLVEDMFQLSDEDYVELLRADWFAQGIVRGTEREAWLVVEASWGVGVEDVERAHARAAILRKAGAEAYGVAMGRSASPEAVQLARELGVLLALDGTLQNAELVRQTP